jgi:hypothetical protein
MGWGCTGDSKEVGCLLGQGRNPDYCCDEDKDDDDEDSNTNEKDLDKQEKTNKQGDMKVNKEVNEIVDEEVDEDYIFEVSDEEEVLEFESDHDLGDAEEGDTMDIDFDAGDNEYILFRGIAEPLLPHQNRFPSKTHQTMSATGRSPNTNAFEGGGTTVSSSPQRK